MACTQWLRWMTQFYMETQRDGVWMLNVKSPEINLRKMLVNSFEDIVLELIKNAFIWRNERKSISHCNTKIFVWGNKRRLRPCGPDKSQGCHIICRKCLNNKIKLLDTTVQVSFITIRLIIVSSVEHHVSTTMWWNYA